MFDKQNFFLQDFYSPSPPCTVELNSRTRQDTFCPIDIHPLIFTPDLYIPYNPKILTNKSLED